MRICENDISIFLSRLAYIDLGGIQTAGLSRSIQQNLIIILGREEVA